MIPAETLPRMGMGGDKGERWHGLIKLWNFARNFVNVTMGAQCSNNKKSIKKEYLTHLYD
jgi:hypothetical protein